MTPSTLGPRRCGSAAARRAQPVRSMTRSWPHPRADARGGRRSFGGCGWVRDPKPGMRCDRGSRSGPPTHRVRTAGAASARMSGTRGARRRPQAVARSLSVPVALLRQHRRPRSLRRGGKRAAAPARPRQPHLELPLQASDPEAVRRFTASRPTSSASGSPSAQPLVESGRRLPIGNMQRARGVSGMEPRALDVGPARWRRACAAARADAGTSRRSAAGYSLAECASGSRDRSPVRLDSEIEGIHSNSRPLLAAVHAA